jgi:hypothetical protein
LDYRSRKINIDTQRLPEFIQQLANGEFLIPTFQRLFVWNPEHISDLWDSIYQCYPIGSIMCWRTHTLLHVHRKVGGFYIPSNGRRDGGIYRYILDGQQRATSLLVSYYGGTGKTKDQFSFDYTLYFDLGKAVFFFEKDYYKHRWEADSALLVRLKDMADLPADYGERLSPEAGDNLEQFRYAFANYRIPLITLQGYDIGGVCAIYERINQTGMRLKNMDILIARGFKNYATVVEEDFPIDT